MKKFLGLLLSLTLIMTLSPINVFAQENSGSNVPNTYSEEIEIKDDGFRALLNETLSNKLGQSRDPKAPITQNEMSFIENLEINKFSSDIKVQDIAGIEHAVDLKYLTIYEEVSGIENISSLSSIEYLKIDDFETIGADLSFLGNKPNLVTLIYNSSNGLKSLSGLTPEKAPKLKTLIFTNSTNLNDISALSNVGFKNLQELDLNGTAVKDITPLKGYTSLKELDLEKIAITNDNRVGYIETVQSLTNLESLHLPYCKLEDSDTVMFKPLVNLKRLVLNINELTNTDFCSFLPEGLETLGLHGNDIKSADNLTRFKDLKILGIGNNNITDLSFLNSFASLKDWGVRHAEGDKGFPTHERHEIEIHRTSIINKIVEIENPFKGVDGNYISFDGVKYEPKDIGLVAEVTSAAPYDKLTIKFSKDTNIIYLDAPYTATLNNGLNLNAEMNLVLRIVGDTHVHKWGETQYEWSADNATCTAKRTCTEDKNHVETETANVVKKVVKPATCTEKGTTEYTATFNNTWAAKQTKTIEDIEMLDHSYKDTWSFDDDSHWHACEACGHKKDVTAHTYEWIVDKEATEEDEGLKHQECTVCSHKLPPVEIPQIEKPDVHVHQWGETEYEWSADNATCTAKRTCTLDSSHVEHETVQVVKKVIKPATDTERGTTEYTAAFKNSWAKEQTKIIDDIDPVVTVPNTDSSGIPPTGDRTNIGLYASLIIMSGLSLALLFMWKRKKALDNK